MSVSQRQVVYAIACFAFGAIIFLSAHRCTTVKATEGTVVESMTFHRNRVISCQYTYSVGGGTYHGRGMIGGDEGERLRYFTAGKTITVFYDSTNPRSSDLNDSELKRFFCRFGIAIGVLGVVFLLPQKVNPIHVLNEYGFPWLSVGSLLGGVAVFCTVLYRGKQSEFTVGFSITFLLLIAGLAATVARRQASWRMVALAFGILAMIVGLCVAGYVLLLMSWPGPH